MSNKVTVTGTKENAKALKEAGELDTEKAGTEAGRDLLPFVIDETRAETGVMRGGWYVQESAFINEVEYASFQEFGTIYVEKTDAIRKAVDKHEETLTRPFEKEQENAARKAGFGRF